MLQSRSDALRQYLCIAIFLGDIVEESLQYIRLTPSENKRVESVRRSIWLFWSVIDILWAFIQSCNKLACNRKAQTQLDIFWTLRYFRKCSNSVRNNLNEHMSNMPNMAMRSILAAARTVGLGSFKRSLSFSMNRSFSTSARSYIYSFATHIAAVLRTYGSWSRKQWLNGSTKQSIIFSTWIYPIVLIAKARINGFGSSTSCSPKRNMCKYDWKQGSFSMTLRHLYKHRDGHHGHVGFASRIVD